MKQLLQLLAVNILLAFSATTYAQLTVTNAAPFNNQINLVQDVLLGAGVTAFNIKFNGVTVPPTGIPSTSLGFFKCLNCSTGWIGIDSGLVMTSGNISVVPGPNNSGGAGANVNLTGDPDLNILAGVTTYDRCILEFDFIPTGDTVKFNYVFASDEYPEFACSSVNDAFGFFLSGPGITGPFSNNSKNIALIPNSTIPVSINTVNSNVNGCTTPSVTPGNAQYYQTNNGSVIQYDGYTVVLEAKSVVIPCDTYHIKLAIADGGDHVYDSGVFIEAKSFSGGNIEISTEPSYTQIGNDTNMYEGCGPVSIKLRRFVELNTTHTVHINKSGSAIQGVDYTPIADSIVFPIGSDTFLLSFTIPNDWIVEGQETITLQFISPAVGCLPPDTQYVTLVINDPIPLTLTSYGNDTLNCTEGNISVGAMGLTGLNGYSYNWNTGNTSPSFTVSPATLAAGTNNFIVTVTDGCNIFTAYDTVTVVSYTPPFSTTTTTDTINCMQTAFIGVTVAGWLPGTISTWLHNNSHIGFIGVAPDVTTNYVVKTELICSGQVQYDTVIVQVDNIVFNTNFTLDTTDCVTPVQIGIQVTNGQNPISYLWSTGANSQNITVNPLQTTNYFVTTTHPCSGQVEIDTIPVTVINDPITLNAIDIDSTLIQCPGDPITLLTHPAQGGYAPYLYLWQTGTLGIDTAETINSTTDRYYWVAATDICFLDTVFDTIYVNVPDYERIGFMKIDDTLLNCAGDYISYGPLNAATNITGGALNGYQFSWDNWLTTNSTVFDYPVHDTSYTLMAHDICATDTAILEVNVDIKVFDPLRLTLTNQYHICPGDSATFIARAMDGAGFYTFDWSTGQSTGLTFPNSDSLTDFPVVSQRYDVTVTDMCDTSRTTHTYALIEVPAAAWSYQYDGNNRVKFNNQSSNDVVSYLWNFGEQTSSLESPYHTFNSVSDFLVTLTVENEWGCTDTYTHVVDPPLYYFFPNAFTPGNADGLNQTFKVLGDGIAQMNMKIYNRWGELVYECQNSYCEWDGKFKGQDPIPGVYVIRLLLEGRNGQFVEKEGIVTILE